MSQTNALLQADFVMMCLEVMKVHPDPKDSLHQLAVIGLRRWGDGDEKTPETRRASNGFEFRIQREGDA